MMGEFGPAYTNKMRYWWIVTWSDRVGEYHVTDEDYVQLIVDRKRAGGLPTLVKVECFSARELDLTER